MDNRVITAPGSMVTAAGTRFHVREFGPAGAPRILCEAGLTMMSSVWAWLASALTREFRIVTYDRAGLGWSDEREGARDARAAAHELRALLQACGISEPLTLLGHSMGAIFNRAFLKTAPEMVCRLIWLDPAHPDQMRHPELRQRMRGVFFFLDAADLLASKNLARFRLPLIRQAGALPRFEARTLRKFLRDPRHLRNSAQEARAWEASAAFVRDSPLPALPLLIISAMKNELPGWDDLQNELARLAPRATHLTFADCSHLDLILQHAHADRAASAIRDFMLSEPPEFPRC